MEFKDLDLSIIYTRDDGSYVVNNGLYHVPNEGRWSDMWEQVKKYAEDHSEVVRPEPTEPEPTAEDLAVQELAQAKADRAEAVSKIVVEVDGMVFDGDETSQTRTGRSIVAMNDDETITWVLHDDTIAQVSKAQLKEVLRKAGQKQTELWTVPYL